MPDLTNMLAWWQWLVLAAVPVAVVLLYFLKLKRRPVEVPSTWLWHKSVEDLHVNSLWQRLRRNLLLVLQLLFLLLVALALLRPSWQSMRLTGSRFVFLVDTSASMQASDVAPTRLEEAKRRVCDLIDQMRSGDAAMVISFADTARVEQGFTDDRRSLHEAVRAIRPTCHTTNLAEALRLAAGLANPPAVEGEAGPPATATRLVILSDGRFPAVGEFELRNLEPDFIPIGSADAANVAVTALSTQRHETRPDRLQVFARLANFGPQEVTVPVRLLLEEPARQLNYDEVSLRPGESRGLVMDLAGIDSGVLRLEVGSSDHLAADDRAWTVLSRPRRARVLLVTAGNEPLRKALSTKAAAELAELEVQPPGFLKTEIYARRAEAGTWNLVVYDGCAPGRMPQANTFFIGSLPPGSKETEAGSNETPPSPPAPLPQAGEGRREGDRPVFVERKPGQSPGGDGWSARPPVAAPQILYTEVSHPLMQWLDLADTRRLAEARPLVVPQGGRVLVDSDAGCLMAIAPRDSFEDLVLGFALYENRRGPDGKTAVYQNSEWPIRVSFSTFVLNLLSYLGAGHDAAAGSLRPGQSAQLASAGQGELTVATPSGAAVRLPLAAQGTARFSATDEPGPYQVRADGQAVQQFAVSLCDAAESDIRPAERPAIRIGDVEIEGGSAGRPGRWETWQWLVLAGIVLLGIEWYVYLRRVY